MINEFFKNINLPDFLMSEFDKENWYLILTKLKELLESNIDDIKNSNEDTLKAKGKVYIGNNCKIGEYVVIDGPVYIGDNVEIGPHCYIRPGSVILDNCVLGHASEIKNSIMMKGSKIMNHCFLGDSIIGEKARLGGHVETSNRRYDQGLISFSYKDTKLETGLDKLGLILGEGSRLGGGVLTAPGSMIGMNTFVSPSAFVSGYIPPFKYIKLKQDLEIVENTFKGELKHTKMFERT